MCRWPELPQPIHRLCSPTSVPSVYTHVAIDSQRTVRSTNKNICYIPGQESSFLTKDYLTKLSALMQQYALARTYKCSVV